MARGLLGPFGIETRFFDPLDVDGFRERDLRQQPGGAVRGPGSLTMEVADVPALSPRSRATRGLVSVLDNTWASPLGFPALERGADIRS